MCVCSLRVILGLSIKVTVFPPLYPRSHFDFGTFMLFSLCTHIKKVHVHLKLDKHSIFNRHISIYYLFGFVFFSLDCLLHIHTLCHFISTLIFCCKHFKISNKAHWKYRSAYGGLFSALSQQHKESVICCVLRKQPEMEYIDSTTTKIPLSETN